MAGGAAEATLAGWAGREAMARFAWPGRLAALAALSVNSSTVPGAVTMEISTPHAKVTAFKNQRFVS